MAERNNVSETPDPDSPLGKIYTTDEVARILREHPRTVQRLIKQQRLRAFRPGRGYRITEAALREFIAGELKEGKDER